MHKDPAKFRRARPTTG